MRSLAWLPLAALLFAAPRAALGQDAMALFKQGRTAAERGDWATACPLFEEAHRQQPDALGIFINLADCQQHIGKLASAWSNFVEAEARAKGKGDQERARYARDQAAALEPRLSRLRVTATVVPGLRITRNGREVASGILGTAFPVDPGAQVMEVSAPGFTTWSTTVQVAGERALVTVEVPLLQKGVPGGPMRLAGFVVGGAGVLGLAAGAALGALTLKKVSDSKSQGHCDAALTVCDQTGLDMQASAKTLAHGSTAALVVGGAALAAGVTLVVLGGRTEAPRDTARLTLRAVAGPSLSGVTWRGEW